MCVLQIFIIMIIIMIIIIIITDSMPCVKVCSDHDDTASLMLILHVVLF